MKNTVILLYADDEWAELKTGFELKRMLPRGMPSSELKGEICAWLGKIVPARLRDNLLWAIF